LRLNAHEKKKKKQTKKKTIKKKKKKQKKKQTIQKKKNHYTSHVMANISASESSTWRMNILFFVSDVKKRWMFILSVA